jgi:hypothetical protein
MKKKNELATRIEQEIVGPGEKLVARKALIIGRTPEPEDVSPDMELEDVRPLDVSDPDFPKGTTPIQFTEELPENYLPFRRQAAILGWPADKIRVVYHQTGIFFQMPMVCQGTSGCPFGKICRVKNRDMFIGKPCPLEVMEVFKHFSGYVQNLGISSKDYVDLQLVADLCRMHLTLWRTDMALRTQGEVVKEVKAVHQATGKPFYQTVINKNRELQITTRMAIQSIYRELVATRNNRLFADKLKKPDADSKQNDISILISDIIKSEGPKDGDKS